MAKVKYADIIVHNKNKFLILLRTSNVKFQPNKYCLPGGHVDNNEKYIDAAKRELYEETKIKVDKLYFITNVEREDSITYYFQCFVDDDCISTITLVEEEHSNYKFIKSSEIDNYDFLLDLKATLNSILNE